VSFFFCSLNQIGIRLTAVDDGDGHQDTGAAANGAHKIGGDGQKTEDGATKGSGSGNDTLEFLIHGAFTMTGHDLDEKVDVRRLESESMRDRPSVGPLIAWQRHEDQSQRLQSRSWRRGHRLKR
jgi:hypothetical protein